VRSVRVSAVAALLLLGVNFVVRAAAAQCSGAACDAFIAPSLLIPAGVLALVAITGLFAISSARENGRAWVVPLIATTVLGAAGPIVAVIVFRDQPDAVVAVATVLFLLTPIAALAYTFRTSPSPFP
jgi:hypothetical protein